MKHCVRVVDSRRRYPRQGIAVRWSRRLTHSLGILVACLLACFEFWHNAVLVDSQMQSNARPDVGDAAVARPELRSPLQRVPQQPTMAKGSRTALVRCGEESWGQ